MGAYCSYYHLHFYSYFYILLFDLCPHLLLQDISYSNNHVFRSLLASLCKTWRTYIPLQLGGADISEVQCKQLLPGSHVEHVVLLAEEQRGEIQDPRDREMSGGPLLCIWRREEMVQSKETRFTS